jgi:hypothetical protein
MDTDSAPARTFEQMLEEGAGGLSGPQCTALSDLIVLHPSTEVGWTAEAWAEQIGTTPELVRSALHELTVPRRRWYATRHRAASADVEGPVPA